MITREKKREYNRKWYANLTPERKEKLAQSRREYRATEEFKKRDRRTRSNPKYREHRSRLRSTPEQRQKARDLHRKVKYGITQAQWDAMFLAQGSCCAICKDTSSGRKHDWATDHCHATGKIRGILCHSCNLALAYLKDREEIIGAALMYLISFRGKR